MSEDARRPRGKSERLHPREPQPRSARRIDEYAAQLEAVLESLDEGLLICDTAGGVRRMNRRAAEIHGYASAAEAWHALPEFADAFEWYDLEGHAIPVEDGPLSRAVRGETFREWKVRLRNKRTGREWLGRCGGTPVRDERGHVVLTVLSLRELEEPADRTVEELMRLARIPQENPDPVFRVSGEHVLLYSNPAGEELCRRWGCRLGQKVPAVIRQIVSAALADGAVARHEVAFDSRHYCLTVAPAVADGYVNIYARDITERRRAREALRQAERKFRTIFDNTSDGIFLLDLETRKFAMCNPSCLQMLGYTLEEFLNLGIPDLHSPADLPFISAQIEEFLKGGQPIRHDIRFRRKDGSILFVDLSPALVRLDGKQYAVVALKDITERKRAEKALQNERDQAREYLRVAGVMMVALDADGRITLINEKGCEILGYRQEEILGRVWFDVCLPRETREEVAGVFHKLMAGDIAPVEYYENAVLRKDGEQRLVAFHNTVLRDSSSRIVGILFSGEDITARQRAEEARREAEERYQALFDRSLEGVYIHDLEGRFLDGNPAVLRMLGYSREEISSLTIASLLDEEQMPAAARTLRQVLETGGQKDVSTYRIRKKNGDHVWVETKASLIMKGKEPYAVFGIARDVTERKQMEEELRRYAEHLEELVAARTAELQESERRYRSLAENAPDIIQRFDRDLRHLYVNPAFEPATGLSPDAVIGKTDRELGLPEDLISFWEEAARTVFQTGENRIIEFEMPTPRGHRHYEAHLVPEFAPDGATEHVLAITRDITERKHMEEALHFTQFAVDHAADAAFWMTEDAGFCYVNEAACRALGYSRAELLTMTAYDIDPSFTESMWHERWRELEAKKTIVFETVHRARDGRIYPVEIRANYVEFGGRAYDCAFAQDITKRKQAAAALLESEERYRILLEKGFDGIFVHENLRIVQLNDRLAEMTGYTRAELMGSNPIDMFLPESQERIRQYIRSGAAGYFEIELQRPDGRIVDIEAYGAPCRFQGRSARIVGLRDITDRKRAEEVLRRLNEQLEVQVTQRTEDLRHTVGRLRQLTLELSQAEDRERKRIADILHDDVQQMLAAAKFHLNLLGSETRSAKESQEIVEQVKLMLKDAIEKSRSLSHELSPALYQVDLMEILEWLARHMQEKHGLTVHVEAHGPVDSPSESVRALLYKVAQELLFNVVKHAGVNEARIRVRRLGPCLYLSVIDRGRGFDPEKLEGAAGFGLLSVRERVQLLGGRMKIRSAPGLGSRLLIAVPDQAASRAVAPAEGRDGQAPPEAPPPGKRAEEP